MYQLFAIGDVIVSYNIIADRNDKGTPDIHLRGTLGSPGAYL